MKENEIADLISFYKDNELDEIFSEDQQDLTKISDPKFKLTTSQKEIRSKIPHELINQKSRNTKTQTKFSGNYKISEVTKNKFIKPVFSTNEALSSLAKKFSNLQNNNNISIDKIIQEAKLKASLANNIEELKKAVEEFDGCNLKKMATNTVFSDGNPKSQIMIIGEAPGNNEDLQGIPFCGDSGKMLDEMFFHIGMTRKENLYITNVIFWRPPGNRRPTDEELSICKPFVDRHIELVAPKVVVLVGATAMTAITKTNEPISKARGKFIELKQYSGNIKSFTIFHPSYLMRQSVKKKISWHDMLTLKSFLK